jgi:hypothetical protein
MKAFFIAFLWTSAAFAATNPALLDLPKSAEPAPAQITQASYQKWARPMLRSSGRDFTSAFTGKIFAWFENEKSRGLPSEVYSDPEKTFVNVERPLRETIELEDGGDIEEGNTVGAEVYSEMPGTVHEVFETMLYRWGKPAGATEGRTYPPGGPFSRRVDYFAPNPVWGPQAYASLSLRRDGGVVKDLADRYMMIVRGNDQEGYDIFMQYIRPAGDTKSEQCFAIAIIRPLANGKTSYKISTRYQGQNYKVLGNVSIGRKQIGFNVGKVRAIQVETLGMLSELQENGKIADHKTDIEWGGQ